MPCYQYHSNANTYYIFGVQNIVSINQIVCVCAIYCGEMCIFDYNNITMNEDVFNHHRFNGTFIVLSFSLSSSL